MPLLNDPFLDQFIKLFIMLVGATLVAACLWRYKYNRRKRKQRAAWLPASTVAGNR